MSVEEKGVSAYEQQETLQQSTKESVFAKIEKSVAKNFSNLEDDHKSRLSALLHQKLSKNPDARLLPQLMEIQKALAKAASPEEAVAKLEAAYQQHLLELQDIANHEPLIVVIPNALDVKNQEDQANIQEDQANIQEKLEDKNGQEIGALVTQTFEKQLMLAPELRTHSPEQLQQHLDQLPPATQHKLQQHGIDARQYASFLLTREAIVKQPAAPHAVEFLSSLQSLETALNIRENGFAKRFDRVDDDFLLNNPDLADFAQHNEQLQVFNQQIDR